MRRERFFLARRADRHALTMDVLTVPEPLIEFARHMFVGPLWPASLLVGFLLMFTGISLIGVLDFDFGSGVDVDFDVDLDTEIDTAWIDSLGGSTIRWLNLDNLPVVIWMSIFTLVFWVTSYAFWYGFDVNRYSPTLAVTSLLVLRNGVIGIGVTKLATEPLNRYFQPGRSFGPSDLIGQYCEVSTSEVNDRFGQARLKTDAAPLILNIRSDGTSYSQGTRLRIISYDRNSRLYQVALPAPEISS